MQRLTFITSNAGKAKYLSDYFHVTVDHHKLDLPEIQSLDLNEIVTDKAQRAFAVTNTPVLVEDVSLTFSALKALPGPLIKWFDMTLGNEGLCRLLDGYADRHATAQVAYALCNTDGVHIFGGAVSGTIADTPRGESGFGWDPIFIPDGQALTWAEMTDDEKHATSMRKIALEKMGTFLEKNKYL